MPLKVILDSNFLMAPSQFRIDLFEEMRKLLNRKIEVIILSSVYEELYTISLRKSPKLQRQAKMALKFIEGIKTVKISPKPGETVDDTIIQAAKEGKCPVATNDRELKRKLRDINIPVIYIRQRNRLELEGVVP